MLFNWFKKKNKLIPLDPSEPQKAGEPADSGQPAKPGKPERKPFAPGLHGKPLGRPAMAGAKKPAPPVKDAAKINTSESTVIRIGKLGEVLLQYNMISRESLEKALAIQQQSFVSSGPQDKAVQKRKLLGEILIENNFVTEEQLLSAFARHCRIPYIKLNKYGLPKAAIQSVPEDIIVKHRVMPVDKIGSMLMLAVTDPYDTNAVEEVKARTGLKVKTILCKQSEFTEMVKFYYPHIQDGSKETPADGAPEAAPKDAASNAPVPAGPSPDGASAEKPQTPQETTPIGEETAVFKIEALAFPEPPPSAAPNLADAREQPAARKPDETIAENIQETPASRAIPQAEAGPAGTTDAVEKPTEASPKDVPAEQTPAPAESLQAIAEPEDKKESFAPLRPPDECSQSRSALFLGETIEEASPAKPEARAESAPEPETPAQPPPEITPIPETDEVNGYDTSLIDIRDLLNSRETSLDENIEVMPEESEPIDVAPYIYPEAKQPQEIPEPARPASPDVISAHPSEEIKKDNGIQPPKIDAPARAASEEKPAVRAEEAVRPAAPQPAPTVPEPPIGKEPPAPAAPAPALDAAPDKTKPAKEEVFKEALITVSEDEFFVARQLFTAQSGTSWEKLYHRSKPSHAEKVDETEFAFYTESSIH